MTVAAAMIATMAWYFKGRHGGTKLETLGLMYWSAVLMWMVDGFFRLAENKPFLELTLDDALLGLLVTVSGLLTWLVWLALDRRALRNRHSEPEADRISGSIPISSATPNFHHLHRDENDD